MKSALFSLSGYFVQVDADSKAHSDGECNRCMAMYNATTCEDKEVHVRLLG